MRVDRVDGAHALQLDWSASTWAAVAAETYFAGHSGRDAELETGDDASWLGLADVSVGEAGDLADEVRSAVRRS
jgi:hypothetical protein